MRYASLLGLCAMLGASPVFAGPAVEPEGPLSPCLQSQEEASGTRSADQPAHAWSVEITTSFSKEEALDDFARMKQDHADLLGGYEPIIVEQCNLSMGTDVQYSARIGMDSREDADSLCAKLRAAGGVCIVQKD